MTSTQSVPPFPSTSDPLHYINQSQQHRHFDQRSHRGRQSLVAIGPESRNGDGNRELEIIARGREALRGGELVPDPKRYVMYRVMKKMTKKYTISGAATLITDTI